MIYGNIVPTSVKDTFFGNLLKKLSADTKFRTGIPVSPEEVLQFCCKFHGEKSAHYEQSLSFAIDWPVHQAEMHDGVDGAPKNYMNFTGQPLTHQFYALNKPLMDRIFNAAGDIYELARESCKFINSMRQRLPTVN